MANLYNPVNTLYFNTHVVVSAPFVRRNSATASGVISSTLGLPITSLNRQSNCPAESKRSPATSVDLLLARRSEPLRGHRSGILAASSRRAEPAPSLSSAPRALPLSGAAMTPHSVPTTGPFGESQQG